MYFITADCFRTTGNTSSWNETSVALVHRSLCCSLQWRMKLFSLHRCSFNPLALTALSAWAVSFQLGLIRLWESDSPLDTQAIITRSSQTHCNGFLQSSQPHCVLMPRQSMFIGQQALKMSFWVSFGFRALTEINEFVKKTRLHRKKTCICVLFRWPDAPRLRFTAGTKVQSIITSTRNTRKVLACCCFRGVFELHIITNTSVKVFIEELEMVFFSSV